MKDYILRMQIEKEELGNKIDKLESYLKNNKNNDETYLELCELQFKYMLAYYDVLNERISHELSKKY